MLQKQKEESAFHAQSTEQVLKVLSTDESGLLGEEAKKRLQEYGRNEIEEGRPYRPILLFLKQFKSVFVYVLMGAALVSLTVGSIIDAYVILIVVFTNAFIGFSEEFRAGQAIAALKKMIVTRVKAYRDGELSQIQSGELVPGDIILLEEGDRVPADVRLIETKSFRTNESSLTGESLPVDKITTAIPKDTALPERTNMAWMGTFVAGGVGKAAVSATGDKTVLGNLARGMREIKKRKGHFEIAGEKLAKQVGIVSLLGALITFFVGYYIRRFDFLEIFFFTIASLVSAIPEGLPAILAIALSIGSYKMARRNAYMRTLSATETLGVVSVIATDKTGTLTENVLTVEKVVLPNHRVISVSGSGWKPLGSFKENKKTIVPLEDPQMAKLMHAVAVGTNARALKSEEGKDEYSVIGDPTEAALVVLAEKSGLRSDILTLRKERLDDMPFNSDLKYRASLAKHPGSGKIEMYVLGAPEVVLGFSDYALMGEELKHLDKDTRKVIENDIDKMTLSGMRVVAVAYREMQEDDNVLSEKLIEKLTFAGLCGMDDPPRIGVGEAIEKARGAGIKIIMTTGDHKGTAVAIAKKIGIIAKDIGALPVLTEGELLKLSEKEFEQALDKVLVFARLTPQMKLRIAEVLQKKGHIVAMTGDGVNDALALKKADVGIAMGRMGTDVAREASEMVLADDNFVSIVNAVEEGRVVFRNVQRSSFFLIVTNFAEHISILCALLFGFELPLLATQILWLNLVTDGVTGAALAAEPGDKKILSNPPRSPKEGIISSEIIPFFVLMVGTMVVLSLSTFWYFIPEGIEKARTAVFVILGSTQLFNVLNMRSLTKSLFKIGLFTNKYIVAALIASYTFLFMVIYVPFFQDVFSFVPPSGLEMVILIAVSSVVLWFGELYKGVIKKLAGRRD